MASPLPPAALLPPPPPSPSPPSASTVGARINSACRTQHTELNRLLMQRLPLALPPNQQGPLLFARGIVPFARIFFFFESEWDLLLRHAASPSDGVQKWLADLRPHGLARATRLENDLKHLRAVAGPDIYRTPDLGDYWLRDMRTRLRSQPHVLMAYAWVFYMATFAGGRWIRQQLANGGAEFWTQRPLTDVDVVEEGPGPEFHGFSFLSFDGDQDGEDIKALFKTRLAEAETLLTGEQKQDIVDVAQQLFERCNKLVGELDVMVTRDRVPTWILPTCFVLFLMLLFVCGVG